MKKIINWFKNLAQDKKDHFYLGVLLGFPLVLTFGLWGGVSALGLATLKELYDKFIKKTYFDKWDLMATSVPIIMFILISLIQ